MFIIINLFKQVIAKSAELNEQDIDSCVDFLPVLAGHIAYAVAGEGVEWISSPESFYFKVVPTTDPNITLGMAFAVFILTIY